MNERDAKLHYIFSVMLVSSFVLQCFSLNLLILLPVYEVYVGRDCGFLMTSVSRIVNDIFRCTRTS